MKRPFFKILILISLIFSSFSYAANPIPVTFDLETAPLNYDVVLSFDYATPEFSAPGSIIFTKNDGRSEIRLFNANVVGNPLAITNAVVQYGFQFPKAYTIHESCKEIDLLKMKDKQIYLIFNISPEQKTISCLLKAYRR